MDRTLPDRGENPCQGGEGWAFSGSASREDIMVGGRAIQYGPPKKQPITTKPQYLEMKYSSTVLLLLCLFIQSGVFGQQSSRSIEELESLISQRDTAIEAASKPINDKFVARANDLLQRAIKAGELDAAMEIKAAVQAASDPESMILGSWAAVSASGWQGTLVFEPGGALKVLSSGVQSAGKWTLKGNVLRTEFKDGPGDTIVFPPKDGKMKAITGKGYIMTLEKK